MHQGICDTERPTDLILIGGKEISLAKEGTLGGTLGLEKCLVDSFDLFLHSVHQFLVLCGK